jgi:hypothetical protein
MPRESRALRRAAQAHHRPQSAVKPRTPSGRALRWWIIGAAMLVVAGGAAWWTTFARPQSRPASVLGEHLADEGYEHVEVGTVIPYRQHPPASGTHYPYPAPAGSYPQGLPEGFWVHSLEHGYIVLLYRPPVSDAAQLEFREMVKDFPKSKYGNVKLVVAPYKDMPHAYAMMAWDWRLWLDTFDRAKVLEFYRQHVDRGREDLP